MVGATVVVVEVVVELEVLLDVGDATTVVDVVVDVVVVVVVIVVVAAVVTGRATVSRDVESVVQAATSTSATTTRARVEGGTRTARNSRHATPGARGQAPAHGSLCFRSDAETRPPESETRARIMATGTVKFFNAQKGYGFISREDGPDVFVHFSNIEGNGYRSLDEGQQVEFEIGQGRKGDEALKVKAL